MRREAVQEERNRGAGGGGGTGGTVAREASLDLEVTTTNSLNEMPMERIVGAEDAAENFYSRERSIHGGNRIGGDTRCQFHQRSTSTFCARRSKKRKKILTT
jgi:hypothetical protein